MIYMAVEFLHPLKDTAKETVRAVAVGKQGKEFGLLAVERHRRNPELRVFREEGPHHVLVLFWK